MKSRILAIILASLAAAAAAEPKKPAAASPEARQIAEEAMGLVAADDLKGFIAMVRRKMPMPAGEIEKIEAALKTQRKEVASKLGKSLGYVLISECRRADTLLRLIYAEKREKNVLRWQFIFYKPRDKWQWVHFYWDSDPQQMFAPCN